MDAAIAVRRIQTLTVDDQVQVGIHRQRAASSADRRGPADAAIRRQPPVHRSGPRAGHLGRLVPAGVGIVERQPLPSSRVALGRRAVGHRTSCVSSSRW